MGLNIRPSTSVERKLLFIETLINNTDKVSKVSDNSVLSGIASGIAKIAGKAEKDIVVAVSQLFPDAAFQGQLDIVAENQGIAPRFGAIGSSAYLRLTANPGTLYQTNVHIFSSAEGVRFELEEDMTIGPQGFAYARVKSSTIGKETNVKALSISSITPEPSGHIDVVNEYAAIGGRDVESDETFRIRIKEGANILARGTIAMLEQLFMKINNKVLRVINQGCGRDGKINLSIATQNGTNLSQTELDEILNKSADFFSLTELKPFGTQFYGIKLSNIEYQPIDISLRADIDASYGIDQIRIDIQSKISKYLDIRLFNTADSKVEWDNLLAICQSVRGVKYIPDQYFYPRVDIAVDSFKLPRVRSFLICNLQGQVLSDYSGALSPVHYPSIIDESYHQTILKNV